VTREFPPVFTEELHYLQIPVEDEPSTNLLEAFALCVRFIDDALAVDGATVFVHWYEISFNFERIPILYIEG